MSENKIPYKIYLSEDEMPKAWYNLRADMKNKPAPLLNPGTLQPMTARGAGRRVLRRAGQAGAGRHHPLLRDPPGDPGLLQDVPPLPPGPGLLPGGEAPGTPAKIYYKFEGNNTSGSHKLNSAIAQAYYAKNQGLKGVTTETGAGQWGTALSMACGYLGLDCKVYMVKCSYEQKPFRREVMRTYGASVTPSPSNTTAVGRKILAEHPGHHRLPGLRHQRGGGGGHLHPRLPLCAGQRPQPGAAPPVRHRPGEQDRPGQVRRQARHHHRLRRRRQQPGRPHRPLHGGEAPGRGGLPLHRRGARLLPQPSPGASTPTTSATPAWSAPWPRCTPWAAASSPPPTTPAACATTA